MYNDYNLATSIGDPPARQNTRPTRIWNFFVIDNFPNFSSPEFSARNLFKILNIVSLCSSVYCEG